MCALGHSVMLNSLRPPHELHEHQAPLSMGFSKQEYWSELPFPPPGDLLNPGIKPRSSASPALADRFFTTEPPTRVQKDLTSFDVKLTIKKMQLHKCGGAELDLIGVLRITTGDFVDCMPEIGPPNWCIGLP